MHLPCLQKKAGNTRGKLPDKVVAPVDTGPIAGLGGSWVVGTEHLDELKYSEPKNLRATPLKVCYDVGGAEMIKMYLYWSLV